MAIWCNLLALDFECLSERKIGLYYLDELHAS